MLATLRQIGTGPPVTVVATWSTSPADSTFTSGSSAMADVLQPAGLRDGDLLLATVAVDGQSTTVTPPSGWTLREGPHVASSPNGNALTATLFWTYYAAGDPNPYAFSLSGSVDWGTRTLAYRGVRPADPVDVSVGLGCTQASVRCEAPTLATPLTKTKLVCLAVHIRRKWRWKTRPTW